MGDDAAPDLTLELLGGHVDVLGHEGPGAGGFAGGDGFGDGFVLGGGHLEGAADESGQSWHAARHVPVGRWRL
ncbi:hypothetical protein ACWFRM_13685 [Streptomyces sp. NPDC055144]